MAITRSRLALELVQARPLVPQLDDVHRAFTTLARWRGDYYLAFREAPDHLSAVGIVRVLRSEDLAAWEEVARFASPGADYRDPHLIVFRDRLHLYFGSVIRIGDEPRFSAWLTLLGEGGAWSSPARVIEGWFVWQPVVQADRLYLSGYRCISPPGTAYAQTVHEASLFASDDGERWNHVGVITEHANETALVFQPDGRLVSLARSDHESSFGLWRCWADQPYTSWEKAHTGLYIQAPRVARVGGAAILVGRDTVAPFKPAEIEAANRRITTCIYLIDDEGREVQKLITLPSGGDTSYAGIVADEDRVAVSYYTQHRHMERHTSMDTRHGPAEIFIATVTPCLQ